VVPLGFFVVVYCDGIPNQEETGKGDPPEKETVQNLNLGKKDKTSSIEKSNLIIDLA
jgi:hypothetical protein